MKRLIIILLFLPLTTFANLDSKVTLWKTTQKVVVYDNEVKYLKKLWYDKTRIIDLLTIRAMECNDEFWQCFSKTKDIWYYQINHIHKEAYKKSKELYDNPKHLYNFQVEFANNLLENANKKFCYGLDNDNRFKCTARVYNWSKKKIFYWKLALEKRKIIKKYLKENFNF